MSNLWRSRALGVIPVRSSITSARAASSASFPATNSAWSSTNTFASSASFPHTASFGIHRFSRMDLISCRNLLIYLGADLQERVIPAFHFALRPGGYLFLGMSENVSRHGDLFSMQR